MARLAAGSEFTLEVPLDASGVEDLDASKAVKVVVVDDHGDSQSAVTRFDKSGRARVEFGFAEPPGHLKVLVGPDDAADDEVVGLQTITAEVSARQWARETVVVAPLVVTTYYWHTWLRWCQTYVVRGRIVCPDGSPVPGAVVTAFDTDVWWWWCSKQEVATATTDITGSFEMKFRWCCGWWPWWWWKLRRWEVEPHLAALIQPVLYRELQLKRPPIPDPDPDPTIFERLIDRPEPVRPFPVVRPEGPHRHDADAAPRHGPGGHVAAAKATFDPTTLEGLGAKVSATVSLPPGLERLRLWPWAPWNPWWDCAPDLIFRATQHCHGENKVIVDENCFDTRYDVPTDLEVTLVAADACCVAPGSACEDGKCLVLTQACGYQIDDIGGNPGAAAAPAGFANPGGTGRYGDRPFAGSVMISGTADCMEGVDFYEFLWSADGVSWNEMPPGAAGDFSRSWIDATDPTIHGDPVFSTSPPRDGRRVYPTIGFFESTDPTWGPNNVWLSGTRDHLTNWLTNATAWSDGLYRLRVRGWNWDAAAGKLVDPRILTICETDDPTELLVYLDNRLVGPGSGHPASAPDHPVTPIHLQTLEPDTDFLQVQIRHKDGSTTPIEACGNVSVGPADKLVVDFLAHDPDGHLGQYTLWVYWGENQSRNLLDPALNGYALLPSPILGPPVPPASPVGPAYPGAAPAPIWEGGTVRLEVAAEEVFPETCAYQLHLVAIKRTVVDCDHSEHRNESGYSFTIVV